MAWDRKTVPPAAAVLIMEVEGCVLHPYRDGAGVWTIGNGATRDLDGNPVTGLTPVITKAQALQLCQRDLGGAAEDLASLVAAEMTEAEASALISFVYNFGKPRASKSLLLWKMDNGQSASVPDEFAKWNRAAGVPLLGLTRRRWTEAAVFLGADPVGAWKKAFLLIERTNDWPDLERAFEP